MSGPGDHWQSMRASDADRERIADILKAAYAEGRLSREEHAARIDRVMAAQTYGDLQRLVADVPTGPGPFPAVPAPPAHSAPVPSPWGSYAPVPANPTEPLAKASLILASLGLCSSGMTSIPAVVTGHMALARINRTGGEGRGLAIAGLIMGYVLGVGMLIYIVAMVIRWF